MSRVDVVFLYFNLSHDVADASLMKLRDLLQHHVHHSSLKWISYVKVHFTILSTDRFSQALSKQQMLEFKTLHETSHPSHIDAQSFSNSLEGAHGVVKKSGWGASFLCIIAFLCYNFSKSFEEVHGVPPSSPLPPPSVYLCPPICVSFAVIHSLEIHLSLKLCYMSNITFCYSQNFIPY